LSGSGRHTAYSQPGGEVTLDALFRAYFVDGRNIGDPVVLVQIAESVGPLGDQAREVLETRSPTKRSSSWSGRRSRRRRRPLRRSIALRRLIM